jgi:hypothetical protein
MSDYYPETLDALPLFAAARTSGQAAAAACLEKAERTTGFDASAARDAVLTLLRNAGRPMSGEELVDACQSMGLVPHDSRAFGPVFAVLAKRRLIEAVGFAARQKGHGTAGARLWAVPKSEQGGPTSGR